VKVVPRTTTPALVAAPAASDLRTVLTGRLDAELRAQTPECYGGLTETPSGVLEVRAVANASCTRRVNMTTLAVERAVGAPVNSTVELDVQYSLAALQDQSERVTRAASSLRQEGVILTSWGVHVSENRLHVGVMTLTPGAADAVHAVTGQVVTRAAAPSVNRAASDSVQLAQEPGFRPAYDRITDIPPWYGADRIVGPSPGCTSGFTVFERSTIYSTTAGHCGYGAWKQFGQTFGSTVLVSFSEGGPTDAQIISANGGASGRIWTGGANVSSPVKGYIIESAQVGGNKVCTGGSFSGTQCSAKILNTNQCHYFSDSRKTICGLIDAFSPSYHVQGGDSGGPVYNRAGVTADTGPDVYARGLLTGINGANPGIFSYTPITRVQSRLGVNLLGG